MPGHPLEPLLTSTGLRRASMFHDVANTLHRCTLNGSDQELSALVPEQIVMALILTNQPAGSPAWVRAERHLGTTFPTE